jgi:hypothetical protein
MFLWCDNLGATYICHSCIYAGTKHIEVDFHYVREKVALGILHVYFILIGDQIVDIFTKPITHLILCRFRYNLNLVHDGLD